MESREEARSYFKKVARMIHPDKNSHPLAGEVFHKISDALKMTSLPKESSTLTTFSQSCIWQVKPWSVKKNLSHIVSTTKLTTKSPQKWPLNTINLLTMQLKTVRTNNSNAFIQLISITTKPDEGHTRKWSLDLPCQNVTISTKLKNLILFSILIQFSTHFTRI